MQARSQILSVIAHAAMVLLVLFWPASRFQPPPPPPARVALQTLVWRPPAPAQASGGGPRGLAPATRGAVPRLERPVFQPPMPVVREAPPKLVLASGVDIAVPRIDLPQWGDPLSQINAPFSGGLGQRGTLGNGHGTAPAGNGGSDGPAGFARTQKVLGATPPVLIQKVEPEYSDEARKVRLGGTVLLSIDIDTQGRVTNVRVMRPLGLGLDEKAMEAVAKWRFQPARKDGRAIAYPAAIEVRFQLL